MVRLLSMREHAAQKEGIYHDRRRKKKRWHSFTVRGERHSIIWNRTGSSFKVSRQVIVQDIALLRAEDKKILLLTGDMFLTGKSEKRENDIRVFCVCHSTKDTQDELQTIVDYGGHVLDVAVDHPLYGRSVQI